MGNRTFLREMESVATSQLEGYGQLASGVWVKASGTPAAGKAVLVNPTNNGFVWGAVGGAVTFVGARVRHASNQSITDDTATILAFDSERFDTDAFHDNATNNSRLTVPTGKAGKYRIEATVEFAADAEGYREVELYLNGATVIGKSRVAASGTGATVVQATAEYDLAATDYVQVRVRHTAGNAINVTATGNYSPEFTISLLTGGTTPTAPWVTDHPDTPPSSPNADDHEYQNGDTIGGTTLGSPGTAPAIAGNRLVITGNAPGVSASMVAVVYTAPSTPYEFTAKIRIPTTPTTFHVTCLLLRSSASLRFRTVGIFRNAADFSTYLSQTATYTALTTRTASANQLPWTAPYMYVRITNDGTTGTYQVSEDGTSNNWNPLVSEALTTHFTGGNLPDQIGVGVDSFASTARVGFIEWLRRTA